MVYVPNSGYTLDIVLASDVTNTSTFTSAYPAGTTQQNFDAGCYKEGQGHSIVNGSDKWPDAPSSGIAFTTFGASTITFTNQTGATLTAGSRVKVWLPVWSGPAVFLTVPVYLMTAIANGDLVTDIRPGIDGYITH